MSSPRNSSAKRSANPVATAPPPKAASKSEAGYLKEQAANAKTAFKQTFGEIATGLGTGVNPAKWTQEHPWIMTLSAAVAGFTAACVAVPSKEQAAAKRLRKLEEALRPPPEAHHESNGKPKKHGLMGFIAAELFSIGSGLIGSFLKAAVTPPPPPVPEDQPAATDNAPAPENPASE